MNGESVMRAPARPIYKGHIGELDGVRAVGLSFVLVNHFWPKTISMLVFQISNVGWIAMDAFFVMSGFLITGILLDAKGKPNYLRTYYSRRALRIFPLYYGVLVIWWVIARYTNYGNDYRTMVQQWGSPMWFTFYLGNVREAMVAAWPRIPGYGPLWSLQIEEQYYLLFPILIMLLRREHLKRLLIAAVFLSPALRLAAYWWQPQNAFMQYVLLPCHCEGLALGGLIALRFRSGPWEISKKWLSLATVVVLGGAILSSVLSTWGTDVQAPATTFVRLAGYSLSSLGCACLILWLICHRGASYTLWLRKGPLQYVGKISYGVYMLHPLALWIMMEVAKKGLFPFHKDDIRFFIGVVSLSMVIAAISWHLWEAPLLRMNKRNRPDRDTLPAEPRGLDTGGRAIETAG